MNAEKQRKLEKFIEGEVIYCVSFLVSELSKDNKYFEELMEISSQYNEETDDYDEALEHWLVSNWFARKLKDQGEMVGEFMNMNIWGRTCSGQAIICDSVIERIYDELHGED